MFCVDVYVEIEKLRLNRRFLQCCHSTPCWKKNAKDEKRKQKTKRIVKIK